MTQAILLTFSRFEPDLYWKAMKVATKAASKKGSRDWLWKAAAWFALVFLLVAVMRLGALRAVDTIPLAVAFSAGALLFLSAFFFHFWRLRKQMLSVAEQSYRQQGPITAELGPEGCRFHSPVTDIKLKWQAVDGVFDLKTGTGLRAGLLVYPLPNESLPDNMSPEEFRKKLESWRTAG